jgi:hypothetical protein
VTTTKPINSDLAAQSAYVKKMVSDGFDFGLTHTQAFVRGIRDLGYKSTATALDEQVDNADQADAKHVHVVWEDIAKPTWIAVADDGHGMEPAMIRLAVVWGGTHREDNREGFGRYGYGLPSSSVSIGRRFTVYSWTEESSCHAVTIDLDDMEKGVYSKGHQIVIPKPVPAEIPAKVLAQVKKDEGAKALDENHGTVVVIEKVDRLTWKTGTALKRNLLEHFGLFYRNFLRSLDIFVQGERVIPVDPLFLMEDGRFYDLDEDRAEALPPQTIKVKTDKYGEAEITVRYSYMPPRFLGVDKDQERGKTNLRFPIRADNNGIIILRNHRQIDLVPARRGIFSFNNDDRYVGVEIDFPAALDEEFSITTSKQQIAPSDRIWDILKAEGVFHAIQAMRRRYDEDKKRLRDLRAENENESKVSEKSLHETDKFSRQTPSEKEAQKQRGEENLKRKAQKRAEETGKPVEEAVKELRKETEQRPYHLQEEDQRGAPFFRVEQIGGQRTVFINRLHPFYLKLYKGHDTSPRVRAALEVILLVLGTCELEAATEERQRFYKQERREWSDRLELALDSLDTFIAEGDAA